MACFMDIFRIGCSQIVACQVDIFRICLFMDNRKQLLLDKLHMKTQFNCKMAFLGDISSILLLFGYNLVLLLSMVDIFVM